MMITKYFKDAAAAENARYTAELSETLYSLSMLEEQTRKITGAYPHSGLGDIKRQQMMGGARGLNRLFERHFQGMRENLLDYYGLLIARGLMDSNLSQLELSAKAALSYTDGILQISLGGLLPFKPKGGVHYISDSLNTSIGQYLCDNGLELYFRRAAVVFIHHYCALTIASGRTRDYDNLERSCIMNVLQKHFLRDDDAIHLITADLCNRADFDHTDIYVMEAADFLEFLTKRDFSLYL